MKLCCCTMNSFVSFRGEVKTSRAHKVWVFLERRCLIEMKKRENVHLATKSYFLVGQESWQCCAFSSGQSAQSHTLWWAGASGFLTRDTPSIVSFIKPTEIRFIKCTVRFNEIGVICSNREYICFWQYGSFDMQCILKNYKHLIFFQKSAKTVFAV